MSMCFICSYTLPTDRNIDKINVALKSVSGDDKLSQIISTAMSFESIWAELPKDKLQVDNMSLENLSRKVEIAQSLRTELKTLASVVVQSDPFRRKEHANDLIKRAPVLNRHIADKLAEMTQTVAVQALARSPYSHSEAPEFDIRHR